MKQSDELLQEYLQQLEAGVPLEQIVATIPDEYASLEPLLMTARTLREAPDPPLDAAQANAARTTIQNAARQRQNRSGQRQGRWRLPSLSLPRLMPRLQLSGGLLATMAILLLVWFFTMQSFATTDAQAATLSDAAGGVQVADYEGAGWQPLRLEDQVRTGQRVRTGPGSTATLRFFDGSELYLAPQSEVSIVHLEGGPDTLQVELLQRRGRTAHDVVPLRGDEAAYVVRTPGASATVHGTSFSVSVTESGEAHFAVEEGEVSVTSADETVVLTEGQITSAADNLPPAEPAHQPRPSLAFEPDELETTGCQAAFSYDGVLANHGSEPDDIAEDVELGYAIIGGADLLENVAIAPVGWDSIAAGDSVSFSVNLALAEGWESVEAESEVKVRIFVANESNWPDHHRARLTVTALLDCNEDVTPTPTYTPTATVTPTVTPTPTITATPVVTDSTDCTGADPHPEAVSLAERYDVSHEEIMSWFCAGYGFGEIEHAYALSAETEVPVEEIFDMRASGMGWGDIWQELGVLPDGPPDDASPPDDVGPPEDAGPPDEVGPPDDAGPPEDAGPPDDVGPPDDAGPPADDGG
ncbi:MAG: FecR family protein, partial [Chloroflexota bacterium]